MVLVDSRLKPRATFTFQAEISTFDGETRTLKNNCQPVVHTTHVRQSAKIILDQDYLEKKEEQKYSNIDDDHKSTPTSSEEEGKAKQ